MKIEREYIAQAIDPTTKIVKFQSANKDKQLLEDWFKKHVVSGKFDGLTPVLKYRFLINGKPFVLTEKHFLYAAIFILIAFNIYFVCKI